MMMLTKTLINNVVTAVELIVLSVIITNVKSVLKDLFPLAHHVVISVQQAHGLLMAYVFVLLDISIIIDVLVLVHLDLLALMGNVELALAHVQLALIQLINVQLARLDLLSNKLQTDVLLISHVQREDTDQCLVNVELFALLDPTIVILLVYKEDVQSDML